MAHEPTTRRARSRDADAIAELNVAAWRAAYRGLVSERALERLSVERRALALQAMLSGGETETWVAEEAGVIVGYASLGPSRDSDATGGTGELYAVYVAPDRVGRGLGRLLLARAEAALEGRGLRRATLWVLAANERARRFYERAGWSRDGHGSIFRWGPDELPLVRYARELPRQKGRT